MQNIRWYYISTSRHFWCLISWVINMKVKLHQSWKCFVCIAEPSREVRSMLRHLIDMLPASSVSGAGRDSAINLLVKQVPRKSLKNPDNSLTLWVIDQGMFDRLWSALFWDLVDITDVKILWLLNRSCDAFLYFSLGLKKILEVAGTVPEVEGGPPLTDNTPMSCSVLLNKLYDDLKSDQERENFNKLCEEYVQ